MRIPLTLLVLLALAAPGNAATLLWDLKRDFQGGVRKQNPNRGPLAKPTWHFLRTTHSTGPIGSRKWHRDGVYVPLTIKGDSLFNAPHDGWIYRKNRSPMISRVTRAYSVGLVWKGGEIVVAPGGDHAVVVGWRSPVDGVAQIRGYVRHGQSCCGINSEINWYLEHGPAPGTSPRRMRTLAKGTSNFGTPSQNAPLKVDKLIVRRGEFIYLIVDSKADGTGTPHHGDASEVEFRIKVDSSSKMDLALPTFEKDIRPILSSHCLQCHADGTTEARLDLSSVASMIRGGESGPAIVPKHPERSYLLDLISQGEMPPEGEKKLTLDQIAKIELWLRLGAPSQEKGLEKVRPRQMVTAQDRQYWAFRTPKKKPLPKLSAAGLARSRTAVDRWLLSRLEAQGLTFSSDVERRKLIRRATFDLLGLPPTPAEVRAFVQDQRPDAYDRLLDRLLASPHYGERWGRHWLDAAGYTDVRLFDGDFAMVYYNEGIWRYRDYVVSAHNKDMPWTQFLQEQLAGDEMVDWRSPPRWSQDIRDKMVATGYLRLVEDVTSEAQYGIKERYDMLFDTMNMVSTSILGLTLDCCRCHNHKFDPLPQRDYYRFMANFQSAYNVNNWIRPTSRHLATVSPQEKKRRDGQNAAIKRQVAQKEKLRAAALKAKDQKKADQLQREIRQLNQQRTSYGKVHALWDVGPAPNTRVLRRGDYSRPGISISAGFPEILSAPGKTSAEQKSRSGGTGQRLALAKWLTERRHPLTARVIVNRVWQHHFGVGIVATADNFGRSGSRATHPDLLDWLAVDFMEQGWSLKHLHRRIMTSTAYRQSSARPANDQSKQERIDPGNKWLWRMNLIRLDAELIRDNVLAVSGQLDRRHGGPPVRMDLDKNSGLSMVETKTKQHGRRSLYVLARRVYPLRFLEVFDSPVMPINCVRRTTSSTVLQSFTFMNGPFVLAAAQRISEKARSQSKSPTARIRFAYQTILSRPVRRFELQRCLQFLKQQADAYKIRQRPDRSLADLCHMLLCTNEFLYVD